jgi:hypothetical protein
MLVIPVGCVDIEFSGNKGPYTYKTNEDVSVSWHLNYHPSKLESYTISVKNKEDTENAWEDSVVLNDASPGEHSPIDRSKNLGKMAEGVYIAAFTSKPNDNFPPINDYGIFVVTPSTGSIQIASFYDANGNGEKDVGEGHEGTEFKITGTKGPDYSAKTGSDGIATIKLPIGQYTITELPSNCWRSISGTSQVANVVEDRTTSVAFKDEPDTGYTIFGYNDSTHNGIAGFTFNVSGPEGTQTLVSGSDGFAKPPQVSQSGMHTVVATPPAGMEMTTSSSIEFDPCIQKQVEFGAKSVPPLTITELSPEDESRMGSNDVLFTWKTSEESTSKLYIKPQENSTYTEIPGESGFDHSVVATNLSRNEWYNFYVRSEAGSRFDQSEVRSIFIDRGIAFTKWLYNVNINRSYSQSCPISVVNTDSEPHELRVGVNSSASDIYFNFLGDGSADKVITLEPGETRDLDLVIHAQDARQKEYNLFANLTNLGPEAIVDRATINVTVHWPVTLFKFEEVSTDLVTLTKTFRVTNQGDPITDLTITPDEALLRNTVVQPSVRHVSLGSNETIDINVSPLWSKDIGAIKGVLTASAADVNKTLSVDFSCKEGRQLYKVVLPGPQLHFDLKGGYCVNQHPITDFFMLPPGLSATGVLSASIGMEVNAADVERQMTPYSTWIKINGKEVGRLSNTIPKGYYKFGIDPAYLSYSQAGLASNEYVLDSDMNRGYTTRLSNARVLMCLENLTLYVCAENEQQAKEISWSNNWIYKPSSRMNVTILSPQEDGQPVLGQPVTVKAKVEGDHGGEKYCTVKGEINGSSQTIDLFDNGMHNDGSADDGTYAGTWVPYTSGTSRIDISASNCAATGHASINVRSKGVSDSDIWLTKTMDPQALDVEAMNAEEGNVIGYTIALGPRVDGLKDVKVTQTLPSYLHLINGSLSKVADDVSLNSDGLNWSTTCLVWNIGELSEPWSVTFDATFNWRLPAGANSVAGSSMPISAVTYANATNDACRLEIPEGEIRFVSGVQETSSEVGAHEDSETSGSQGNTTPNASGPGPVEQETPGVEPVFTLLGIIFVALALRRR